MTTTRIPARWIGSLVQTPTLGRSTLVGAGLGVLVALPLLLLSLFGGGESDEAASILAGVVAMPTTFFFDWLDWGHYASQWNAFISTAVPLNGAVLGFVAGALTKVPRGNWFRWAALLGALWIGSFSFMWWRTATH